MRRSKFLIGIFICVILLGAGLSCFFLLTARQRADYRLIADSEYDTVFLSMYPVDTYEEESFLYYRGMNVLKISNTISSPSMLSRYMRQIAKSGNTVRTVYLGICPDKIGTEALSALFSRYPSVTFEVILSYPDASYWTELSQSQYEKELQAYTDLLTNLPSGGNIYFWASTRWLVENPGNYETHWLPNRDIARTIMLNSDTGHGYLATAENGASLAEALAENTASYRSGSGKYADLSNYDIVLFGDSVIGNYTDSASIPGVLQGLTGATVYNCGFGGGRASQSPDELFSLNDFVTAFFLGNPSNLPQDKPLYQGILSYAADSHQGRSQVFVLNFGINDYYVGSPVYGDDPYDINTFAGALRSAARDILTHLPDAQIILCTPNLTFRFEYGQEPLGPEGEVFSDYADAVKKVAEEMGLDVLDNFYELGITPDNISYYLEYDLVHPNATGRFLIGSRLAALIR